MTLLNIGLQSMHMITTQEGLKEMVLWMRKEKVAAFEMDGIKVHFSPHAFVADLQQSSLSPDDIERIEKQKAKEEEEILYHSAG